MTRKDTIIAAALVNAGLLIVLFVSALKNEEKVDKISLDQVSTEKASSDKLFASEPKKAMGVDEVEEVLKQYVQKDTIQPVAAQPKEPVAIPVVEEKPAVEEKVAAQEEPTVSYIEVKVKKGDMLEKIARVHQTTVSAIMKANSLSSSSLKIGQVLKVPANSNKKAHTSSSKAPMDPTSAKYYTIKAGDNLWTIAVRNHIKVEDLLKLNNITEEKAKRLKPGDTIRTR